MPVCACLPARLPLCPRTREKITAEDLLCPIQVFAVLDVIQLMARCKLFHTTIPRGLHSLALTLILPCVLSCLMIMFVDNNDENDDDRLPMIVTLKR